jgi:hypothetical protein
MEAQSWDARKQAVRDALYRRLSHDPTLTESSPPSPLPSTTLSWTGTAASPGAPLVGPSGAAAIPATPSSATSVTDTDPGATPPDPHSSSTPAVSTPSGSGVSMVWTETPLGYVERGLSQSIAGPNSPALAGLPPNVRSSLERLATGRHEPIGAVIHEIAEFFIEAEDERCEGPLIEALTFYLENYLLPE